MIASLLRDPFLYGVALVTILLCAPFFRFLPWLGDEGVILHAAVRILGGQALYRDFFEFLPPGSFLIVATWMKLFGAGFASVRVLAAGVIATIAVLLYTSTRVASRNRPLAALLAIGWVVASQGKWTVINHHWFATAASMASGICLLRAVQGAAPVGAAFAAGLFGGATAVITSTRGTLMCLAVPTVLSILPRPRSRLLAGIGGVVVVPAAAILYLAVSGTVAAAFDDVIRYPAQHYSGIQAVPFGSFASVRDSPSVAFFPVSFVLAGATLALMRGSLLRDLHFRAVLALAIVGVLGAYPRPDISHINFTVPLGCPLFALVTTALLRRLRSRPRTAVSTLLIVLGLVAVGYGSVTKLTSARGLSREVPTSRGSVVQRDSRWTNDFATVVAKIDRIPPGDAFFFYPYIPMLPYLTDRRHVAAFDVMTPGYTTSDQFRETCGRVMTDAQWVVIDRSWSDPRKYRYLFPAMRDPDPPERRDFEAALWLAFDTVLRTSNFELRQRTATASTALCDKIGKSPYDQRAQPVFLARDSR